MGKEECLRHRRQHCGVITCILYYAYLHLSQMQVILINTGAVCVMYVQGERSSSLGSQTHLKKRARFLRAGTR